MSFERLKTELEKASTARVNETKQRYHKLLQQEQTRLKETARLLEESIIETAEAEATHQAQRLHQEHQLQAKARILEAKQAELAATKQAAIDAILAWDSSETTGLLKNLLALLPKESGTITAGELHHHQLKSLVSKEHQLNDTTIPGGGFIFRTRQTEINLTIEHLVTQLFARHQATIAHDLFA